MNVAGQELIPALERGVIDGGEWINTASDLKLGLYDVGRTTPPGPPPGHRHHGYHDQRQGMARTCPRTSGVVETATTQSILDGIMYFVEGKTPGPSDTDQERASSCSTRPRLLRLFHQIVEEGARQIRGAGSVLQEGSPNHSANILTGGSLHQRDQQVDAADLRGRGGEINTCRTDGRVG